MAKVTHSVPPEPTPVHIDVPPRLPEEIQVTTYPDGSKTTIHPTINQSAAERLAGFLKENNIKLVPTVMEEQCSIIDGGIVLNDKPLIKIQVEYRK